MQDQIIKRNFVVTFAQNRWNCFNFHWIPRPPLIKEKKMKKEKWTNLEGISSCLAGGDLIDRDTKTLAWMNETDFDITLNIMHTCQIPYNAYRRRTDRWSPIQGRRLTNQCGKYSPLRNLIGLNFWFDNLFSAGNLLTTGIVMSGIFVNEKEFCFFFFYVPYFSDYSAFKIGCALYLRIQNFSTVEVLHCSNLTWKPMFIILCFYKHELLSLSLPNCYCLNINIQS